MVHSEATRQAASVARLCAGALVLFLLIGASSARAETVEPATSCIYSLQPKLGMQPSLVGTTEATAVPKGCYSSTAAATAAVPLAEVVIGIDYGHTTYGGASKVWTASHGCSGTGASWQVSLSGGAWDNRVRSATGFSNCNRFRHFDGPNYGGAFKDCLPKCESMGAVEALTSSEKWFAN